MRFLQQQDRRRHELKLRRQFVAYEQNKIDILKQMKSCTVHAKSVLVDKIFSTRLKLSLLKGAEHNILVCNK